jgi:hypothetical protein
MKAWGTRGMAPEMFNSALEASEWSASRPDRFISWRKSPVTHFNYYYYYCNIFSGSFPGSEEICNSQLTTQCYVAGVCTNATAPSVSSINRILRNRAAERAAAEFARAAGYGLYHPHPYAAFPWHPAHLWPAPTLGLAPGSSASSSAAAAAMTAGASPASSASPTSIGHQHDGSAISTSDLMVPRLIGVY